MTYTEYDFYFFCKLAGIKHEHGEVYSFRSREYKVRVRGLEPELIRSVGGKARAYKLLRHAVMVHYIANQPGHGHIISLVGPSLEALHQKHPAMRAMCENAR